VIIVAPASRLLFTQHELNQRKGLAAARPRNQVNVEVCSWVEARGFCPATTMLNSAALALGSIDVAQMNLYFFFFAVPLSAAAGFDSAGLSLFSDVFPAPSPEPSADAGLPFPA
jgi:hypothetical protein